MCSKNRHQLQSFQLLRAFSSRKVARSWRRIRENHPGILRIDPVIRTRTKHPLWMPFVFHSHLCYTVMSWKRKHSKITQHLQSLTLTFLNQELRRFRILTQGMTGTSLTWLIDKTRNPLWKHLRSLLIWEVIENDHIQETLNQDQVHSSHLQHWKRQSQQHLHHI